MNKIVQLAIFTAFIFFFLNGEALYGQPQDTSLKVDLEKEFLEAIAQKSIADPAVNHSDLSHVKISGPTNVSDSLALVALFNSSDGLKWNNREGWLYLPVPQWRGVTVNGAGRVIGIELASTELDGTIPQEMGLLSELRTLDISDNFARGVDLPQSMSELSNLQSFKLSGLDEFSPVIFEWRNLRELLLTVNSLDRIPEGLGRLTQLKDLLIISQAVGPIPNDLGNLTNLEEFRFTASRWTGSIPDSFWNMTKLKSLSLRSRNRTLEGELSSRIGNLRDLEILTIDGTNLTGSLPKELANLRNLQGLHLSNNEFTSIPQELLQLVQLNHVDLDNNKLSGTIPLEIAAFLVEVDNRGDCDLNNNQASFCIPNTPEYQALNRNPICRIQLSNSCAVIVSGPLAPSLSTPRNGDSGFSRQPSFAWNGSADAQKYQLEINQSSNFQGPGATFSDITSTSYSIPQNTLSNDQRYFWRVRASNGQGDSPYSEVWSFTTEQAPVLPSSSTLTSPAHNSSDQDLPLRLSWQASANADVHILQVSEVSSFATRVYEAFDINGTNRELNSNHLNDGVTYYWRVKGRNGDGESPWSEVWSFTTKSALVPPSVVTLTSPADNSSERVLPLRLSWVSSVNADVHVLQVSKQSSFATRAFEASDINGSSQTLNANHLDAGATYFWRVKGRNSDGDSPWSDVWSFVTKSQALLPGSIVLTSPSDGAQEVMVPITLTWQASSNAQRHILNISKDPRFSSLVAEQNNITGTSHDLGFDALEDGTKYFWRVKGRNDDGDSPWSSTRSFTTFQRSYAISFDVGEGGSISIADTSYVNHGESLEFSITPDEGYIVSNVVIDEVSQGAIEEYTFDNVVGEHNVAVLFALMVNNENENPSGLGRIEIYPNPVRSILHFKTDWKGVTSLKIFDSLGREAFSFADEVNIKSLDVSSLPVGVYHVEIVDESGDRVVKTIAKVN